MNVHPDMKKAQTELADAEAELHRRQKKAAEVRASLDKVTAELARFDAMTSVTGSELVQLENTRRQRQQLEGQFAGVQSLVDQQASAAGIAKEHLQREVHADAVRRLDAAERELLQRARLMDEEFRKKLHEVRQLSKAAGASNRAFVFSEETLRLKTGLELAARGLETVKTYAKGSGELPERYRPTGS
jgi:septal ring factor EnvC (AmiA/AmiB activator)